MLHKQFFVWSCNGCSISPLTDFANNIVYQELLPESGHFTSADEKVYIELEKFRRSNSELILKTNLKNALTKKTRLRGWGYSQGEYLYLINDREMTMKYKTTSQKRRYIASSLQRYTCITLE